ncbi:hypothetical protein NXF25_006923 [Crotalus adamanteus]|uniref:Integrase catalytic domain-containing protein n=1 Tax=Crotalus adamanteus TaxID=8729 RepID=A0AAW1C107_CROAD
MAKIGRLSEFDVSHPERWESYVARVENYLKVNQVREDSLKAATLLCVCGQDAFEIAENLAAPVPLESVSYADLKKLLKEHFQPKMSVIAWRHTFKQRDQQSGESAKEYIAALRKAAKHCEFKDLEERLRDRFVCGLRHRELQQRLFAKEDLSFQDALIEVTAEEAAGGVIKNMRPIRNSPDVASVHQEEVQGNSEEDPDKEVDRLHPTKEGNQKGSSSAPCKCIGCGGRHRRTDCKFRSAICRACRKQGHIAAVCLGRRKVQPQEELRLKDVIVSDNGPQFTSSEFQAFLQANMIRHATSAPFHPSTNGMAERMVRITKDALKKLTYGDWHHRVTGPLSYEVALDNGRVLRRHIDQLRPRRDLPDETPGSFPGGEGDPLEQREGHELLPTSNDGATNGPFQDSASAPNRNSKSLSNYQAFTPTPARESPRGYNHYSPAQHSTPVREDTREHSNKSYPARELAHNPQSWPDLTPSPTGGQTYREVVEEPSPDRNTSSPNQGVTEFWEGTESHTSPDTERGLGNGQPPDRSWMDLGGSTEMPSSGYHFKGPEGVQLGRSARSQSDRSPGLTSPAVPGRYKLPGTRQAVASACAHGRVLAREK